MSAMVDTFVKSFPEPRYHNLDCEKNRVNIWPGRMGPALSILYGVPYELVVVQLAICGGLGELAIGDCLVRGVIDKGTQLFGN